MLLFFVYGSQENFHFLFISSGVADSSSYAKSYVLYKLKLRGTAVCPN